MAPDGLMKAAFSALIGVALIVLGLLGSIYAAAGHPIGGLGLVVWLLPIVGLMFFVGAYLRVRYEFAGPEPDGPDRPAEP